MSTSAGSATQEAPEPQTRAPADVFISYARTDQAVAGTLAETLKAEGFQVWFDSAIYAGAEWESLLRGTLASAKAVLVLWSRASVKRRWVLEEARVARSMGKLVPVAIDDCKLPSRFNDMQAAKMSGWKGEATHPELGRLLEGLARLAPPSRVDTVRPGYDDQFLGIELPLPAITGVGEEFRYLHFSVVMNPARRLAWYVAYNMQPPGRAARGDDWLADPMLPPAFQPGNMHFKGSGYDRGHLVSPRTVSWGPDYQAQLANHQAFFWTNTAPQHPMTNQRTWLAIENWERQLTIRRGQAVGFSGPVLADDDPPHGAIEQRLGRLRVRENFRLPRRFWKVVAARDARGLLGAAAFMVTQHDLIQGAGRAPATLQSAAAFRTTIGAVETITGLDFGLTLRRAKELPEEPR